MTESRENYTMGYGSAATAIMAMRTAETHAGFFLPYLKPGMSILDRTRRVVSLLRGLLGTNATARRSGTQYWTSK